MNSKSKVRVWAREWGHARSERRRAYIAFSLLFVGLICLFLLAKGSVAFAQSSPVITSFNPVAGPVATTVTLTGSDFTGTMEVSFSGTMAVFEVVSDSEIQVYVPAGAATGPINVTNDVGTGTAGANFIVLPNPPVLVGAGDIARCAYESDEETAKLLDAIPGTVITLGDNVYPDGTKAEFDDCYEPNWGRHKARTQPSPGNHDYHVPGASGYFNYFGAAAGEPGKGYYSYDVENWHIIVLNSECSQVGGCGIDSPQGQWLLADLATNASECTLAYWHIPLFSSDPRGTSQKTQDFWHLLYEAGADVVLSSHFHAYEQFKRQDPLGNADPIHGIQQFIVGTGGGSLTNNSIVQPNSVVINGETYGVLKMTLHPSGYEWEFVPIAGETFTDLGSGSCNQGPKVVTGANQAIVLPDSATLNAVVTDDGLPGQVPISTTWSQVSGPGTVTFEDPGAVNTVATFSRSGTFRLRLTADDGEFTISDELTINVNPEGTELNTIEARVGTGSDDAEEDNAGILSLNSSDLELVVDGVEQTVGMRFNDLNIPQGATIQEAYLQFKVDEISVGSTSLSIRGEDVNNASTFTTSNGDISTRSLTTATVMWSPDAWNIIGEAGPNQRSPNLASIVQEIIDRPGWASGNSLAMVITGNGKRVAESYNGDPAGAPLLHIEHVIRPHLAPSADAGPDQTVQITGNAVLNGVASDDGLPDPPGALSIAWSQVSGPGTVTFADASSLDTTATLSAVGTYELRLSADDSELIGSDEIIIEVQYGHDPPMVDAGPDQNIALTNDAILDATVSDDGLPDPPGSVTVAWSQVSGSGTAFFVDANSTDTVVSFSQSGLYVLRLAADDGELSASDQLTIAVTESDGSITLERGIAAGIDDGEEDATGSVSLGSSDLELVFDQPSNQTVGLHFNGIIIPQGAEIRSAYVQFKVDETSSEATSLTIQGEDNDNAAIFIPKTNMLLSSRPKTDASVTWLPATWETVGETGPDQQTPDISAIIQEIVDRPGWAPGNSLVIIITGNGKRVAEAYDGDPDGAPLLNVVYSPGGNQAPTVDAGSDQIVMLPNIAALDGTVTDDGLPIPPGTVATTWSLVTGPDIVTFGDSNAIDTTANFSGEGSYILRLMADDGELITSDDVVVTVNQGNEVPVANDDSAATEEDVAVNIDVLANDTDLDGDNLTVITATQSTSGTVVVEVDDTITYTPTANFNGIDTFTYGVSDGNGGTDTATVTVTVNAINDDPVASDDGTTTDEDVAVNIDVLANDTDLDGDNLTVITTTQPVSGTVLVEVDDTVTYTPTANFNGVDTFTYDIGDGNGGTDTATVTVTVNAINDDPVANDDSATTDEDVTVNIDVLANDTDLDGDSLTVTSVTQPVSGTAVIEVDNTISYTPTTNFNGVDTFTYDISDGNGGTDTATVTVTVNAVNDDPVANDDSATTDEDVAVNIDVLANDTDLDGDNLTVTSVTQPVSGTVVVEVDDSITYTPTTNFSGIDTFNYDISDDNGGTDTATVSVSVSFVNSLPDAVDDSAATDEDVAVNIDVLANDTDLDGDNLTVTSVTQPANGLTTLEVDNTITYTPDADFNGVDSFTYDVSDGNGGADTATVTVTVNPVNDSPTAADDSPVTDEDVPVNIDVLADDSDVDGDSLSITSVTQPANGLAALEVDNTITYTPDADFNGVDSFTYDVSDGNGGADTATVTVTVNPVNDNPTAADDNANTDEDVPVNIDVLLNDSDLDGDSLSVTSVTQPANGSALIEADDTITYTPDDSFSGVDSFTYDINDGNGSSDTARVTVAVNFTNNVPDAVDDIDATDEDAMVNTDVLANDSDLDGDSLSVSSVTQPANGSAALEVDNTITYTPDANFNGVDSFTYDVSDGNGGADTATVTVTVNPVNDNPSAADDSPVTDEDVPVNIDVLADDSDVDGDSLSVTSVTQPANGLTTLEVDNTITYTPDADFNGVDSFTYDVSDGNGGADTATVTVTVNPVNDAPSAVDDNVNTDEDVMVNIDVLLNDSDIDGDSLTVMSVTQPAKGSAVIEIDDTITYTPDANFNGVDTFTYDIDDGNGGADTATVTVTVNAVNDAPVANDDNATTTEDTAVNIDVLANDMDLDGGSLTVTSVTQPASGTAVIEVDDTISYTPTTNFNGVDIFTYDISDGNGGTDTATVTVTVNSINDDPLANDDSATTDEDVAVNIDVLANDTDLDGDSLTVTSVTQPVSGTAVIEVDDTISYTPTTNFNGLDTFTYDISDGNGGTDTATVTVTVNAINDDPAATDDNAATDEDVTVNIDVLANDTDLDGDSLTVTSVTQPVSGTAVIEVDDTISYTPTINFNGLDTFTYDISDGNGGTDTATVTVTVNSINDDPLANDDSATTDEDVAVNIDVLANDTDLDGDSLTVTSVTQPVSGTAVIEVDDTISYTPTTNFNGLDTFTYDISDGNGGFDTAVVTITVSSAEVNTWADSDVSVVGSLSGSYLDTQADDGNVEAITEKKSGGKPANRFDSLLHRWTFDIPPGGSVIFYINAWLSESGDDGQFAFSSSSDGQNYVPWFIVDSTDPDNYQVEIGPGSGTVYVQVEDVTQIPGSYALDTISIDEMHFTTNNATNASPIANFTYDTLGLDIDFSDISVDPDGVIAAWNWDFGDGEVSSVQNPTHQYVSAGTYTVTLTATDDQGATGSITKQVTGTAGGGLTLSAVGYKVKGLQKVDLTWSGGSTAEIEIYRDGQLIVTVPNNGYYTDHINLKGGATYSYEVCELDGGACSNTVTVVF